MSISSERNSEEFFFFIFFFVFSIGLITVYLAKTIFFAFKSYEIKFFWKFLFKFFFVICKFNWMNREIQIVTTPAVKTKMYQGPKISQKKISFATNTEKKFVALRR